MCVCVCVCVDTIQPLMKSSNIFRELNPLRTCLVKEIINAVSISLRTRFSPKFIEICHMKSLIKKGLISVKLKTSCKCALFFPDKQIFFLVSSLKETQKYRHNCGHRIETALDLDLFLNVTQLTIVVLCRIKKLFALSVSVLDWFISYLRERSQRVSPQGVLSNTLSLLFGVP